MWKDLFERSGEAERLPRPKSVPLRVGVGSGGGGDASRLNRGMVVKQKKIWGDWILLWVGLYSVLRVLAAFELFSKASTSLCGMDS